MAVRDRSIAVTASKGGVGKSSVAAHIAYVLSRAGSKVLLVDVDPAGSVLLDFGVGFEEPSPAHVALGLADQLSTLVPDDGRGLCDAVMLQDASRFTVLRGVRPNLDVIPGGSHLSTLAELPASFWTARSVPRPLALFRAIEPIAREYDVVLYDSGPGMGALNEMVAAAARFLLLPTRSDAGSLATLASVGDVLARIYEHSPDTQALGVVLFGVNPSATRVMSRARQAVAEALGPYGVPTLTTAPRYVESAASDARALGVLAHELQEYVTSRPRFFELSANERTQKVESWSRSADALARDYLALALEVMELHAAALAGSGPADAQPTSSDATSGVEVAS